MALYDTTFPERLRQGFITEYNSLRDTDGLTGDALFYALVDFTSGSISDLKRQAAGLAVLGYLFECCEVFER